jgi:hypothetical protein
VSETHLPPDEPGTEGEPGEPGTEGEPGEPEPEGGDEDETDADE